MILLKLKETINNNSMEEAIILIEEIGDEKMTEAVPFLIEQLESTENHLLRNTIALALSDIGKKEAVEPLLKMLRHPITEGYRGSLLYALQPLDYSAHTDLLVDFLIDGNFEVSRQSFLLIESLVHNIPNESKKKYIEKLKGELDVVEEKIDFLSDAIDMLKETKRKKQSNFLEY